MFVVTSNIHAGTDGYGRQTDVLEELIALGADLLFIQELWRGERDDQFERLTSALDYQSTYVSLSDCVRVTSALGGRGWQPVHGLLSGDRGLYFDGNRTLSPKRRAERDSIADAERGTWGVGLFSRLPVRDVTVEPLHQLRRDKTSRALIIAALELDGRPFYAVAIHGAHLSHGSLLQYRCVARRLNALSAQAPVVVAGDFNCWRPLLRTVLPRWKSAVRARTWPAWRPHSQIDHILLRGPWRVRSSRSIKNASDHRALACDLTWS